MGSEPATVVIQYRARVGKEELAKQKLAELANVVIAQERECLGIEICQDPSDPVCFLLYERWPDRAIYLGPHMQTPHLRRFIDEAPEFFSGPPEITVWRAVAEVRPPTRREDGRAG